MHAEFIFCFYYFLFVQCMWYIQTKTDMCTHAKQAVTFVYLSGSVVKISCGMTLMSFPR